MIFTYKVKYVRNNGELDVAEGSISKLHTSNVYPLSEFVKTKYGKV